MRLIYEADTGKIKTEEYKSEISLDEVKEELLRQLEEITMSHILSRYPDTKQKSDLVDKEYFLTFLIASGLEEQALKKGLLFSAEGVIGGMQFKAEVENLVLSFNISSPSEQLLALEQLLKCYVRITFLQKCKEVYRKVKAEIVNAVDIADLPDLRKISFPELPI